MKIALLSFGGLTKSKTLTKSGWTNEDAPSLPIEACRVSKSGKLVLAINPEVGVSNRVYFGTSKQTDLNKAIAGFMEQEKIGEKQIGIIYLKDKVASEKANAYPKVSRGIAQWARAHGFDAVIWNGLGRRFKDELNIKFSVQNALNYVGNLQGKAKTAQNEYLRDIPAGIATPVLDVLKQNLPPIAKKPAKKIAKAVKKAKAAAPKAKK